MVWLKCKRVKGHSWQRTFIDTGLAHTPHLEVERELKLQVQDLFERVGRKNDLGVPVVPKWNEEKI